MQHEMAGFDPQQAAKAYVDSLGPAALEKAAQYTIGNHWIAVAGLGVSALVTLVIVRMGLLGRIEGRFGNRSLIGPFLIGVVFVLVSSLLTLPWTLYTDWWREFQFGRTSQPLGDYLAQSGIGLGLSAIALPVFFTALYGLIRLTGRFWWLWGGMLTAGFLSLFMLLVPLYVQPLFNEYTPLPEGEVRDALEGMATEVGIPVDRIFVYDGSRQSNNFTANVAGVGASKRIAISDVALGEADLAEVRAVTGHEIGHYVLNHVWHRLGVYSVLAIGLFFIAGRTYGAFAGLFGVSRDIADAAGLPVLLFMLGLFGFFAQPITNALTRMGEAEADQYSLRTVNEPDALATALVKTAEYRNPRPARWQELLFYTHPAVERRVLMAMQWKADHPEQ